MTLQNSFCAQLVNTVHKEQLLQLSAKLVTILNLRVLNLNLIVISAQLVTIAPVELICPTLLIHWTPIGVIGARQDTSVLQVRLALSKPVAAGVTPVH